MSSFISQSELEEIKRRSQQRLQEKEKRLEAVKQTVITLQVSSEERSAGAAIPQLTQTLLQPDSEETSDGTLRDPTQLQ